MYEDLPGYDRWKTTPPDPKEPKIVERCYACGNELYEGEECYYIDNEYYCEHCIHEAKVILDKYEE